jgi:hypothetical protein
MRGLLVIGAALALAGCGGDDDADGTGAPPQAACTEIGCAPDGVEVEVAGIPAGEVEIALCVEKRKCVRRRRGEPLPLVGGSIPQRGDRVRVTMIVRKDGREIARATRRLPVRISRPNGPDCPPPCRYVRARFDVPSSTLEEA